jgi:hypothetical protein
MSKPLTANDAAILAFIAENPGMPGREFEELLDELSNEEVASIARAVVDTDSAPNDTIRMTAQSLRAWATSNRTFASGSRQVLEEAN